MPDPEILATALRWLLVLTAFLVLSRARSPLAVQLCAAAFSFLLLVSLELRGWPDLTGRVLKASLGLHLPWLLLALLSRRPWAEALSHSAAWLYAGFYIVVGVQSFRHDTPLSPGLAGAVILFGGVLLLVPVLGQRAERRP